MLFGLVARGGDRVQLLPRDPDADRRRRLFSLCKERALLALADCAAVRRSGMLVVVHLSAWLLRALAAALHLHPHFVPFAWYRIALRRRGAGDRLERPVSGPTEAIRLSRLRNTRSRLACPSARRAARTWSAADRRAAARSRAAVLRNGGSALSTCEHLPRVRLPVGRRRCSVRACSQREANSDTERRLDQAPLVMTLLGPRIGKEHHARRPATHGAIMWVSTATASCCTMRTLRRRARLDAAAAARPRPADAPRRR